MSIHHSKIKKFQTKVFSYYHAHGRHNLPWRKTTHPYRIWISELMLQQTQVSRVIEKYTTWLQQFPTLQHLALASTAEVITAWSGLGYNRRALYALRAAQVVQSVYRGRLPLQENKLLTLPGIGKNTAAAIQAYAWNKPVYFLETNIKTVLLQEFFPSAAPKSITDSVLLATLKRVSPLCEHREWYWALMDYGTFLKKQGFKNSQSSSYALQAKFSDSNRYIRGNILKELSLHPQTEISLIKKIEVTDAAVRVGKIVKDLIAEGFIMKQKNTYHLRVEV